MKIQVFLFFAISILLLLGFIINNSEFWFFSIIILLPIVFVFDKVSNIKEDSNIFFDKSLLFDVDKICIENKTLIVDENIKLTFAINDWDNKENFAGRQISYFNGIDNYCKILYDQEEIFLQFYIDSEIQFNDILSLFESWYNKGIDLTEKDNNGETLLLNKEANYLEIARLRKR
jgi:hypothetical protein